MNATTVAAEILAKLASGRAYASIGDAVDCHLGLKLDVLDPREMPDLAADAFRALRADVLTLVCVGMCDDVECDAQRNGDPTPG